jgi:hypothetical protein
VDGEVTSADIGDSQVATGDLANGAVTQEKIADGAIQLTTQLVSRSVGISAHSFTSLTTPCLDGTTVISGGFNMAGGTTGPAINPEMVVQENRPIGNGYTVRIMNPTPDTGTLAVFALSANPLT